MEHWVQHYSELYSRENVATKEALNNIECLPVLEELDSEPTSCMKSFVFVGGKVEYQRT